MDLTVFIKLGNSLTKADTLFNNREDFTKPLKGDKL
ncbi:hypothetical protein EV282_2039 [Fictibacillus sp. BK138]|nr:hypothetical protein EV282_2039 [Fictibacillus sp. BK138]